MCQIIHKLAGYTLPYFLLATTCNVNSDGWGLMMYDPEKGLMHSKEYNGENDPEAIYDFLENLHDNELYLHFRYKTRGKINSESCHPFVAFNDFDREVVLMHNGTLTGFGNENTVDSDDFAKTIVGPLYGTFLKSGVSNPLQDALYRRTIAKFTGVGSKIVIMDNVGDVVIVNHNEGEMFTDYNNGDPKTFWISNKYSFNFNHRGGSTGSYPTVRDRLPPSRRPAITTGGTQKATMNTNNGGTSMGLTHTDIELDKDGLPFSNTTSDAESFWGANFPKVTEIIQNNSIQQTIEQSQKNITKIPTRTRTLSYYKDVCELKEIDELLDMTNEDISDLVDCEPEHAKMFIKDLIFDLYTYMFGTTKAYDEQNLGDITSTDTDVGDTISSSEDQTSEVSDDPEISSDNETNSDSDTENKEAA